MWKELARPEGLGRVWFAGEATQHSTVHRSTVRGAWHSGVRAAEGVIASLGPTMRPPVELNIPGASSFTPSDDEAVAYAQKRLKKRNSASCCIQ